MTLPASFLQQLRDQTDIISIIGQHVTLKKAGEEYVGKCPFHEDKTPSFSVNAEKGYYCCRGCNAKGDALEFFIQYEGMSFTEAVQHLCKINGISAPSRFRGVETTCTEEDELFDLNDRAQDLYSQQLSQSPAALAYLKARGIDRQTISRYGIGYAPRNYFFLSESMADVRSDRLEKAGLIHKSHFGNQDKMIDWFYDRIVFPIRNSKGRTIAFGARLMHDDESRGRKYTNSPETLIFKKGLTAYGLFEAIRDIRKQERVIVTEGYLDVVLPASKGIQNIVCSMGTSISKESVQTLFKAAKEIIFCFDGDEAGRKAALRAMAIAIPLIDEFHAAKFTFLPHKMDPDEFVKAHGPEAFLEQIDKAIPLSKLLIQEYSSKNAIDTAEGRARFAIESMTLVNSITAPTLRALIADEIKTLIGQHIPLPEPDSSPVQPQFPAVPIRKRGFINHRARLANAKTTPQEVPTLALRVLALILREHETAQYFDASWLTLAKAREEEIDAVRTVIRLIQEGNSDKIENSSACTLVKKAMSMISADMTTDVATELSYIVNFLSEQQARVNTVSEMLKRKAGAPSN